MRLSAVTAKGLGKKTFVLSLSVHGLIICSYATLPVSILFSTVKTKALSWMEFRVKFKAVQVEKIRLLVQTAIK